MTDSAMMRELYELGGGKTYYGSGWTAIAPFSIALAAGVTGKRIVPVWLYVTFIGDETFGINVVDGSGSVYLVRTPGEADIVDTEMDILEWHWGASLLGVIPSGQGIALALEGGVAGKGVGAQMGYYLVDG